MYRSMTALSVVTVAFPTEGCVDEHMEQDGEVYSPTTAAAFDCLYRQMLRDNGRGKAVALLFATVQLLCLANVGLGALLTVIWRTLISTKSTVFHAESHPSCHADFSALARTFPKAMNRIIAALAHSVDTHQASFPQRPARHPRRTCQSPAMFHNVPQ